MPEKTIGVCKLCRDERELEQSHIIPKFAFRWMKKTGSGYLRQAVAANTRLQDGPTEAMLCHDCETRFSSRETYFANKFFHPYLENENIKSFGYDERLAYFVVSILWRVIHRELDLSRRDKHQFLNQIEAAEAEWRAYLLGRKDFDQFDDNHIFITGLQVEDSQPVQFANTYMTRATDGTIASSSTICFVYAKFSRFMLFGFLTPRPDEMVNTRVNHSGGTLTLPQEINDGTVGEFVYDRAGMTTTEFNKSISEAQRTKIADHATKNEARIQSSDLGRALAADRKASVDPTARWPKT